MSREVLGVILGFAFFLVYALAIWLSVKRRD